MEAAKTAGISFSSLIMIGARIIYLCGKTRWSNHGTQSGANKIPPAAMAMKLSVGNASKATIPPHKRTSPKMYANRSNLFMSAS